MIQIKTMDPCFAGLVLGEESVSEVIGCLLQLVTGKGKLDYNGCSVGKQPEIKGTVFADL